MTAVFCSQEGATHAARDNPSYGAAVDTIADEDKELTFPELFFPIVKLGRA
jgi:hypothetical protein